MFRLDRTERYALSRVFPLIPPSASSWLFGSRLDKQARGGDIDILIEFDASPEERLELSHRLTVGFRKHCDERIDVVVLPKTDLDGSQKLFRESLVDRLDLKIVVNAPLLDHVALVVADLEASRQKVASFGYPLQDKQTFDDTGALESYVGEEERPARLLLMQPIRPGSCQRALAKRGPGLHHIGVLVPSMETFLNGLVGTGWLLHPASLDRLLNKCAGPVFLARPGAPLIEVSERAPSQPTLFAPLVEALTVCVREDLLSSLSCLGLCELSWTAAADSELQINAGWRKVSDCL